MLPHPKGRREAAKRRMLGSGMNGERVNCLVHYTRAVSAAVIVACISILVASCASQDTSESAPTFRFTYGTDDAAEVSALQRILWSKWTTREAGSVVAQVGTVEGGLTTVRFTVNVNSAGNRGVTVVIHRRYFSMSTEKWKSDRETRRFAGMHRIRPLEPGAGEEAVRIEPDTVVDPSEYWIVLDGEPGETDFILPEFVDSDFHPRSPHRVESDGLGRVVRPKTDGSPIVILSEILSGI